MFNIITKKIKWEGKDITIETGKIARQSKGAVVISCEGTIILCTANAKQHPNTTVDFFPLTVNYQEKMYANGKIPGGFFKRELKPSDKETLASRIIDRSIRPLFDKKYKNETQVICTVLSYNNAVDPEVMALIGASAALAISELPFDKIVAGIKIGYIDGNFIAMPDKKQLKDSDLNLMLAATEDSVVMIESSANELSYKTVLEAIEFGKEKIQPIIKSIKELAKEVGKEKWAVETIDNSDLTTQIQDFAIDKISESYKMQDKQTRNQNLEKLRNQIKEKFLDEEQLNKSIIEDIVKNLEKSIVRKQIIENKKRIDGRKNDEIRSIEIEVGLLPKVHGTALFTRGETQALVTATLGSPNEDQLVDSLEGLSKERFLLHYNFLPFCTGEVGFLRGPARREIGHGTLALRALKSQIPSAEDFRLAMRIVSEITESNGSSSMATVCGASLALMDAGVPIKNAVAGIAMGLIKEDEEISILSDIMGDEDHLGDMDFKVAGTKNGLTALQMDIKIQEITSNIMENALVQATEGLTFILSKMNDCLSASRKEFSKTSTIIKNIKINSDKIKDIIGPAGKTIRRISEDTNAKIDIQEDGYVTIIASNLEEAQAAQLIIDSIIEGVKVGQIYDGVISTIVEFGAFVSFSNNQHSGLIHISEFSDQRIKKVTDIVSEGAKVKIKVIAKDFKGKVKLSYKAVNQDTGEENAEYNSKKDSSNTTSNYKQNTNNNRKVNSKTNTDKQEREVNSKKNTEKNTEKQEREASSSSVPLQEPDDNSTANKKKKKILFWK